MATNLHNLSEYDPKSVPSAQGMRFGIVVSEWNHHITGSLLEGAQTTLLKHGVSEEDILVMTCRAVLNWCSVPPKWLKAARWMP